MKLNEVFNTPIQTVKRAWDTSRMDQFRQNTGAGFSLYGKAYEPKNKNVAAIGRGNFATALKSDTSHEVNRINRGTDDLKKDPYFQYVRWIAANDAAAYNPYFPRVYKVKVYENKGASGKQKYFYVVNMEELIPLHELNVDELNALYRRITGRAEVNLPRSALVDSIAMALQKMLSGTDRGKYNHDEQLVDAMNQIKALKIGHPDFTDKNVMARRTSVGPQLVLADPLY